MLGRPSLPSAVVMASAVLGLVIGITVAALAADDDRAPGDRGTVAAMEGESARESRALRVLRSWDARRARAFARGDGAALTSLYVGGSRTGAVDRAVLDGYRSRGLRVEGMSTQVLSVLVLHDGAHRIEVRVTDVLVDAAVVDADEVAWALPRDRPTTRRVVLVRRGARWLVEEVYPAG